MSSSGKYQPICVYKYCLLVKNMKYPDNMHSVNIFLTVKSTLLAMIAFWH